jgi:hypothetical protein
MEKRKVCLLFLAMLSALISTTNLNAADFLYFWEASTDPSVTAYGIYQHTEDSSYAKIDEVSVQELDNPATPSYLVTGLADGTTYWLAVTSISASGSESNRSNQTCITVNGSIVDCTDTNEGGSTVYISCFITAAGR